MKANKPKCEECGKPLGQTVGRCHDCGGRSHRGGKRIPSWRWKLIWGMDIDTIWDGLNEDERETM